MFPGQGAQKNEMCLTMKDSAEGNHIFKRAEQITGYNVLEICLQQNQELKDRLKSTEFFQVAFLVGCMAKIAQLKKETPEMFKIISRVAGLSVGEFCALVYAEVISFEDAVSIVQKRGRAMEQDIRQSATAMASVLGPTHDQLRNCINNKFPSTEISTYLADTQHAAAGSEEEIEAMISISLSQKFKDSLSIIDVRKLRVAGAFHSQYMEEAAQSIAAEIKNNCTFKAPTIPVLMNVTGKLCEDPEEMKTLVCRQLVEPVMRKQVITSSFDLGVRKFLEISPSRVLSATAKSRILHCKGCTAELIIV